MEQLATLFGDTDLSTHRTLLARWLDALIQLSEVDVVWLTGSLASGRATRASDIDLRLAIADTTFAQFHDIDPHRYLQGLGEYLRLEARFLRALTAAGIIVELGAVATSELPSLEHYEWAVLWTRAPAQTPPFRKLANHAPAHTWREPQDLTVTQVREWTHFFLVCLAQAPVSLQRGEVQSARFQLDDVRTELIKLMYRRLGILYPRRYKHFSEVLPSAFMGDLAQTHTQAGADPLDLGAIAQANVQLFAVIGRHLQALSEQAGGGFEPRWYWRLHAQIAMQLLAPTTT